MRAKWSIIAVAALVAVAATPASAASNVTFLLDFTDYDSGPVEDWLAAKGFTLKADTGDRRKVDLDVSNEGLVIETKQRARALLVNERADVIDFQRIRIAWKVDRYPEGANYDAGVRNEALMVMVLFGRDRISSGSFLIPDSPYFIGLFLCKEGSVGTAHVGRYFKKGGRYLCLDRPDEGDVVTSEFDLTEAFRKFFDADDVPVVSGLILQADTTDSNGGGKARATISSIEFTQDD